jgi:quercetin dioxygenase-like cupin family protein
MVGTDRKQRGPIIGHEFRFFGDRARVLESSRDTSDGTLRLDYFAAPRARVPEHVHSYQEERFEVLSGRLGLRVGGKELILGLGQRAVGPPGIPHEWWNPDDEEAHFVAGIRPGRDVEILLETVLGLSTDGKIVKGMIPRNPLQLAVLVREAGGMAYPTVLPAPIRKALFLPVVLLAYVGRLFGYRASYPQYGGLDAAR